MVRALVAAGRVARDGWLVLGLTLLLFVAAELLYRAQGAARRALRDRLTPAAGAPAHPYAGQAWWATWKREVLGRPRDTRYDPYRAFWGKPGMLRFAGIDSAGRRVTVQPPPPPGARRVYLFGGSTMWGFTSRDSATIGAWLARSLAARGVRDIEIVNYAQPSYNVTQEVISLLLALRDGARPDIVVFLDGNNDVGAAFQAGEAGHVLNENLAAQRWRTGGAGVGSQLAHAVTRESFLVQRVLEAAGSQRQVAAPEPARACAQVTGEYVALTRGVEALGREYGFAPIFLWQPMVATTGKPLTPFERTLRTDAPFDRMLRVCTGDAERAMAERGGAFVSLTGLFDRDTATVFVDKFAHLSKRANGAVGDTIAGLVAARLARASRR